MIKAMLDVRNLHVEVEGKPILRGVDLLVRPGEIHAIMGLNGSGKSTLANVLAGREGYTVTEGRVNYLGYDLLEMPPEERACRGVFMAFQYPVELTGVSGSYFLRTALNAQRRFNGEPEIGVREFKRLLEDKLSLLELDKDFSKRGVNEGFSGGEKKRNEILQLALLEPRLALLDETDSGLDIDALKIVANGVNSTMRRPDAATVVITHYQRLLNFINPDRVHVMIDGEIVRSGGAELALEVEQRGYSWVRPEPRLAAYEGGRPA